MTERPARPIRFVVIHKPGPMWQYGVDFRQQEGVGEHVQHYLKLYEQGKLQLGGPFLIPDEGGMMVTTKDVSQEEIETFAAADRVRSEYVVKITGKVRLRPAGAGNTTGPEISVTSCPAAAATSASAYPILPLERFDRNRTGSTASRVGPAVIRKRMATATSWEATSWRPAGFLPRSKAGRCLHNRRKANLLPAR